MSQTLPNVLLRGGPDQMTEHNRVQHVIDVESPFKVLIGNAYEHFRPTPETVRHRGHSLRVFEWSRRTYVAE